MRDNKTRMVVEAGIMIALAYVLSMVKLFQMPNGGTVTAGSMIPILIFAFRWGGVQGMFVGAVYGVIEFLLGPKWSFHIASIAFDYVVAFGALGLAGFFRNGGMVKGIVGVVVGIAGRFVCHVLSGVIVWASYAPEGMNPWIYSIVYNGTYLSAELVISIVLFALLYKPLVRSNTLATSRA
ncbi:MAG: energy-coupled thiamine transporter ThiT [Clostridia bacterium]|nr:energy-coupled thiamine transporter ThiT [Clostridia bacterium]